LRVRKAGNRRLCVFAIAARRVRPSPNLASADQIAPQQLTIYSRSGNVRARWCLPPMHRSCEYQDKSKPRRQVACTPGWSPSAAAPAGPRRADPLLGPPRRPPAAAGAADRRCAPRPRPSPPIGRWHSSTPSRARPRTGGTTAACNRASRALQRTCDVKHFGAQHHRPARPQGLYHLMQAHRQCRAHRVALPCSDAAHYGFRPRRLSFRHAPPWGCCSKRVLNCMVQSYFHALVTLGHVLAVAHIATSARVSSNTMTLRLRK
jgi:hypothetical protein